MSGVAKEEYDSLVKEGLYLRKDEVNVSFIGGCISIFFSSIYIYIQHTYVNLFLITKKVVKFKRKEKEREAG